MMRSREEIEKDVINGRIQIGSTPPFVMPLDLEVLLDIRELIKTTNLALMELRKK